MEVKLYRLFAVQDFGKRVDTGGKKVAVYVNTGKYPDPEILTDAQELSKKMYDKFDLFRRKTWLYENNDKSTPGWTPIKDENRLALKFLVRVFEWSYRIMAKDPTVEYAIFVESTNKKDWHGEKMMYKLKYFDEVKSGSNGKFSGCDPVKTIKL